MGSIGHRGEGGDRRPEWRRHTRVAWCWGWWRAIAREWRRPGLSKREKGCPYEDNNSQDTSRDGTAQERVKRKHSVGGQDTRTGGTTPLGTGRDRAHGRGRGGGGGENWLWKNVTKKGEPTGVDRSASDVKSRERGSTGRETRRQKRACDAGLQGLTGTWGSVQGRQDSECRTGGGFRCDGILFGQAIQDRNEGGTLGAKSGADQSQGGIWEGGSVNGG